MFGVSRERGTEGLLTIPIETWRTGGQSQLAYCKAHDLSYVQLTYWRRRVQRAEEAVPSDGYAGYK